MILTLTDSRLSHEALRLCGSQLALLEDLDWLPKEHRNTVGNVFYLSFVLISSRGSRLLEPFLQSPPSHDDFLSAMKTHQALAAQNTAAMYTIADHIGALKQMRDSLPRLSAETRAKAIAVYEVFLQAFLDTYKWHIKDVGNKSGVQRAVERKFKRSLEIDNLIDLLEASAAARDKVVISCPKCTQRLRVRTGPNLVATCPQCNTEIPL